LENVTTMIFYSYCRLPEDRREGGRSHLGAQIQVQEVMTVGVF